MEISCTRCGKKIKSPDASNADYVMASDTIVREPRVVLTALKHNQATLDKAAKMKETDDEGLRKYPDLVIDDTEYDAVEVPDAAAAVRDFGDDLVKVVAGVRDMNIQKTGIVCPDCYKLDDLVIWGVHKE